MIVDSSSAVIRVESGMSFEATTTGPVVGGAEARGPPPVPPVLPPTSSRIPTNATIARKTPTSKTRRFERFKLVLPDE